LLKLSDGLLYLAILSSLANAIIVLVTTLLQVEKRAVTYLGFVNSKTLVDHPDLPNLDRFSGFEMERRITGIAGSGILFGISELIMAMETQCPDKSLCWSGKSLAGDGASSGGSARQRLGLWHGGPSDDY